jgi:hypothetical protein
MLRKFRSHTGTGTAPSCVNSYIRTLPFLSYNHQKNIISSDGVLLHGYTGRINITRHPGRLIPAIYRYVASPRFKQIGGKRRSGHHRCISLFASSRSIRPALDSSHSSLTGGVLLLLLGIRENGRGLKRQGQELINRPRRALQPRPVLGGIIALCMGSSRDRAMYRSVGSRRGMVGLLFRSPVTRGIAYSAAQGHGGQRGIMLGSGIGRTIRLWLWIKGMARRGGERSGIQRGHLEDTRGIASRPGERLMIAIELTIQGAYSSPALRYWAAVCARLESGPRI